MMRVALLFLLILSWKAEAQVTMEDFLLAAWQEPAIKSISDQDNFLNAKPYQLAPIQKLEFRTKSNQLDRTRQDYALRLTPSNPWEVKRTNQYFKTYQEVLKLDKQRMLKESLMLRYNAIINWLYYDEIRNLKEEDKLTTEKLLSILEAQRYSGFFDAKDYVDLKLTLVEKTIELEEARFNSDNQQNRIEILQGSVMMQPVDWVEKKVLTIALIEAVVDTLIGSASATGEIAYRQKKIELANREWQLEKSNLNIGFVQPEYEQFRLDQNRRPWSISMGLIIPIFNPNKGDMTKRKLEAIEAQGDLIEAKDEQQTGQTWARTKIKSLVKRHHEIDSLASKLDINTLAQRLQVINDSNPISLVRVQNNLIKIKATQARLKHEILLTYIEFLSYSEVLQAQPMVNYLSPDLSVIVK